MRLLVYFRTVMATELDNAIIMLNQADMTLLLTPSEIQHVIKRWDNGVSDEGRGV